MVALPLNSNVRMEKASQG